MNFNSHKMRYVLKGSSFNTPVSFFLAKEFFSLNEQLNIILECSICLDKISVDDFCLLSCGHYFCVGCITPQNRCSLCLQ